jgi:hypothetical protein
MVVNTTMILTMVTTAMIIIVDTTMTLPMVSTPGIAHMVIMIVLMIHMAPQTNGGD